MKIHIIAILMLLLPCFITAQVVDFELKDLKNNIRNYSELKGEKLTLIDFWATWCKPCKKAIPELNSIYNAYKEKGVEIIGVNCDGPRSISKVIPLSRSLNIQYPVLIDIDTALKNELNIFQFPTLIMVNPSGEIIWIHEGFVSGDAAVIRKELDKQLKSN